MPSARASTIALAAGSSRSAGGTKTEDGLTGRVMQRSFGRTLIGGIGVVVIVVGAVLAWRALPGKRALRARPLGGAGHHAASSLRRAVR
ncbi:MAG: DUF1206 domain-containing protein [Actinomycetota bacterium]|nr:DUF1206 domain-containing protein [Actinomycetota bacterium]